MWVEVQLAVDQTTARLMGGVDVYNAGLQSPWFLMIRIGSGPEKATPADP